MKADFGSDVGQPACPEVVRASISVHGAIETLRRQEATLNSYAARARKKVTPEQHARVVKEEMRRIYECDDEDRAAEPLDPYTVEMFRKIVAKADAAAEGDNNDGGSAA